MLSLVTQDTESATVRPRRRRRDFRRALPAAVHPRFFKPAYQLGGTSRGYGLGHAWSGGGPQDRYERLQMGRGVMSSFEPITRPKRTRKVRPPGRKARRAAKLEQVGHSLGAA